MNRLGDISSREGNDRTFKVTVKRKKKKKKKEKKTKKTKKNKRRNTSKKKRQEEKIYTKATTFLWTGVRSLIDIHRSGEEKTGSVAKACGYILCSQALSFINI